MKKKLIILTIALTATFYFSYGQDCVKCDTNNSNTGTFATSLGEHTSASGNASFSSGYFTEANGTYSTAIGKNTEANGITSFASGAFSIAEGSASTALGMRTFASGTQSVAIGSYVHSISSHGVTIGSGFDIDYELINNTDHSILMGVGSDLPTFCISSSSGVGKTGKIGIGNVTDPDSKLHIRSDDGEIADLFIEPNNWSAGEYAKLILGDTSHFIKAENTNGLEFNSQNNFIFSGNNTGFGVNEPKAKVHINGDLLFEQNMNGIIMKSEDGNCWKGTISNTGELQFTQIDCGLLTSIQNKKEQKHSEIFIYPNPTKGDVTIEYTGNKKNLRAEFHTVNGLLIGTYKISNGENRIELINVPDQMILAAVYTTKGELISTDKILINK